jgi:hypothetical protein
MINEFETLMEEARGEAYVYFYRRIRPLPKKPDGKIKKGGPGFDDNDVDAFRHAYVSGVFTQVYGEKTANILGLMNELDPAGEKSNSLNPKSQNMDLWNNRVGRKYGKATRGRKTLLKLIHQALTRGELIIDLKDTRKVTGATTPPKHISKPIITIAKSKTGRNEVYYDLQKGALFTRQELVDQIDNGNYPGYSVKQIRGVATPVSKRDKQRINNIG